MYKIFLLQLLVAFSIKLCAQSNSFPKADLYKFEGTYEFDGKRSITLGIFDELNERLVYLDLHSLKLGILLQKDKNRFVDINDTSKIFNFYTDLNSNIARLSVAEGDYISLGHRIKPHQLSSISFSSGKNTLKGDLYLPLGAGPHSVVVFAHGSGASTRSVGFFTTYFLQLGIGVLTFDKQGAGESTGDWEAASFDELANDLMAGIAYLKTRPDIDPKKIGLMGNSQGGWVGSIVASKTPSLAFLLVRVGSGEDVFQTISYEYLGSLHADAFEDKDIPEIMEMYEENWRAAAAGKTWEDGNMLMEKYKSKLWFKKLYPEERVKTVRDQKWWIWLRKNLTYDSYPYLKQVSIPTLWLLGEKDWNVNSKNSAKRINEALGLAKNMDFQVSIIPKMAHHGMEAKTGYQNETPSFTYARGFWERLTTWLVDRGLTR